MNNQAVAFVAQVSWFLAVSLALAVRRNVVVEVSVYEAQRDGSATM